MAPYTPTPPVAPSVTESPEPTATSFAEDTATQTPTTPVTGTPTTPATGVPTATPNTPATGTPTMVPTGTPAGTATGPIITYLGISTADDRPIESVLVDSAGRPIFSRVLGAGLNLIVEARPGTDGRPVGVVAFSDDGLPDLQIIVSRPLGDGSPEVCDVAIEGPNGGVPAVVPPVFSDDPRTVDAINDLGCRVNDGTGLPRARGFSDACTRFPSGQFSFVNPATQAQFCLPIAHAWAFPMGDTIVTARVRSTFGTLGPPRQIVVRITRETSATPVPPVITHLGLAAADDRILGPSHVDDDGRNVYPRVIGHGFSLVIEAAPGPGGRPVGNAAFIDGFELPDLQLLVSRDLGDGDPAVCDVDVENSIFGGIPGIDPPVFRNESGVIDAINDLGCRVNDGTGAPLGRPNSFPCTRDAFGNFTFINPASAVQFCLPIARAWKFHEGDTIVAARVRSLDGGLSPVSEIVVQLEPEVVDECESGGPGERLFTVDLAASMLLAAGFEGNVGTDWVASQAELCAGPGVDGVFPLRLMRDFTVGSQVPGGNIVCARLRAAGSNGVLDCAGALAHDLLMVADNAADEVDLQTGLGRSEEPHV